MNQEFLITISQEKLSRDLQEIFNDYSYLGIFQKYGSCCFAITDLLTRTLKQKGYNARIQACGCKLQQENVQYFLGYPGYSKKNQVEGHVVCIVNEHYVIDFGLGNIRKYYDHGFYRAIACDLVDEGEILAKLNTQAGAKLVWEVKWVNPAIERELEMQDETVQKIFRQIEHYQENRIKYSVRKAWPPAQGKPIIAMQRSV